MSYDKEIEVKRKNKKEIRKGKKKKETDWKKKRG